MAHSQNLMLLNFDDGEALYETLCEVDRGWIFQSLGACRQRRHTISSRGQPFQFAKYGTKIASMLENSKGAYYQLKRGKGYQDKLNCIIKALQTRLENEIHQVGPFNSHHVVHLAALLGLLPLEACRYANVNGSGSRGPEKLIMTIAETSNTKPEYRYSDLKKRIPKEVAKIIFDEIHDDLAQIFGKESVSKDKLENMFCELWRLFDNWIKQTKVRTSKSLFDRYFHPIVIYLTKCTSTYKPSDVLGL